MLSVCPCWKAYVEPSTKRQQVDIFICDTCGMVFATGFDALSHSDDVVDTDPEFYSQCMAEFAEQSKVAQRIVPKRLKAYAKIIGRPVTSLLEIGCGTGAYADAYVANGIDYHAVEIEPDIADSARAKTNAPIETGNFLELDMSAKFDAIFASQVFEHVTRPNEFVQKIHGLLADGGLLHFDVPNHASLTSSIRKVVGSVDYGFIQPPHHMLAYTPGSLEKVVRANGFSDVTVNQYRNDEPVWGQLVEQSGLKTRMLYLAADMIGRGSLLSALASKRGYHIDAAQSGPWKAWV